jgi:hypothetical protein
MLLPKKSSKKHGVGGGNAGSDTNRWLLLFALVFLFVLGNFSL